MYETLSPEYAQTQSKWRKVFKWTQVHMENGNFSECTWLGVCLASYQFLANTVNDCCISLHFGCFPASSAHSILPVLPNPLRCNFSANYCMMPFKDRKHTLRVCAVLVQSCLPFPMLICCSDQIGSRVVCVCGFYICSDKNRDNRRAREAPWRWTRRAARKTSQSGGRQGAKKCRTVDKYRWGKGMKAVGFLCLYVIGLAVAVKYVCIFQCFDILVWLCSP